MRFRATLQSNGKTVTGIEVPDEVVISLGAGKRPPVRVTINGYTYRSSIAVMAGKFMIGVSAENRKGAGVVAGDEIDVDIDVDTESREVILPPDFAAALNGNVQAKVFFEQLSYSNQRRHVLLIEQAKTVETRQRRIAASVARLQEGKA
ncbi:YdeI/OmpD-associated family protein [Spirosoma endbachense]|uniref:DUF1905 domain-containing protein n=1 Tax=Spirosoma endbachense TaxID=2666025 RepID=A0A6P1VUL9_9BACT|nr:YdeI/OmpD-associated family protein [Spirosoma endbachense]QHV95076.1 DUF1905 domain-containing protein [Spirosoma endbachense]